MNSHDLTSLIQLGETSSVHFKQDISNELSIAQEMVAFVNAKGGQMLVGISDKDLQITGLSDTEGEQFTVIIPRPPRP